MGGKVSEIGDGLVRKTQRNGSRQGFVTLRGTPTILGLSQMDRQKP